MLRFLLLMVAVLCSLARPGVAADVTVFAAASLKSVLEAIAADWHAETGHRAVIVPAGSSILARQIQAGAPADIFVSANQAWMDVLEGDGLLRAGSRRDLAGNRLVVVAHGEAEPLAPDGLVAAVAEGRLAMALPDAVPAGIYGKAALVHHDLWSDLAARVAQTDNVRAALALVATGEAPFGIVYATDAQAEPRVSTVLTFAKETHPRIAYPAAILDQSEAAEAEAFMTYLLSAKATFQAHGFTEAGGE
ncbi:MAG: molybdate ABC transporter substrate-binding protein [Pseudomonadota bacterium]